MDYSIQYNLNVVHLNSRTDPFIGLTKTVRTFLACSSINFIFSQGVVILFFFGLRIDILFLVDPRHPRDLYPSVSPHILSFCYDFLESYNIPQSSKKEHNGIKLLMDVFVSAFCTCLLDICRSSTHLMYYSTN